MLWGWKSLNSQAHPTARGTMFFIEQGYRLFLSMASFPELEPSQTRVAREGRLYVEWSISQQTNSCEEESNERQGR